MRRALIAVVLCAAPAARAWESACSVFANPAQDPSALKSQDAEACRPTGLDTARHRWIGRYDEHRLLFEATRELAGLPAALSATTPLQVFTTSDTVAVDGGVTPTLIPSAFEAATRMRFRQVTPGELAQLPDYSYALWDWAAGHETCPLSGASDATDCHDFAAHMGPVNANHFVPQSQRFYAHYHALALGRAAQCAAMKLKVAGEGGRFDAFLRACEWEALAYEAVGHHFLQDAWSMGHMWQRWGGASLADFPGADDEARRDRAVLVALVSGLLHGARTVLQAVPSWTGYDVNDALCAPWADVRFMTAGGTLANGIGDNYLLYLAPFSANALYDTQSQTFFSCAASGMLEVYRAAGESHGPAMPGAGLVSVDPTSATCFGQRATNQAMARGAAINLKVAGAQAAIPLDARFVTRLVPQVARSTGKVPVPNRVRTEFRLGLSRFVTMTRIRAKEEPLSTDVADGQWGELLGAKPNGQYSGLPAYVDPPLPWSSADPRATHLGRLFHRAHAAEWCAAMDDAALRRLKDHAADPLLDAEGRAVACTVCAELAVRHLRVGASAVSYDTAQEPLCALLAPGSTLLYREAPGVTEPFALATGWCCP
ncbi:MAG: hypothetical protein AMXMBFR34_34930 [Myxococcaceae bacterium]